MINGLARTLRNSILSLAADAMARASNTILFILISRWLGPAEGGLYALSLTYALLFTQLSFWGMDQLLIREVAKNRTMAAKYIGNFIMIRAVVSLVLFVLMAIWVKGISNYSSRTSTVILIVGLGIIAESISNVCQTLFFAFEQVKYATFVGWVLGLMRLGGGTWILLNGGQVEAIAILLCASSFGGLALNIGIVYWHFPRPIWQLDVRFWLSQLGIVASFVLINLFYIIEFQADTVLLSLLKSGKDIGIYNAATTFLFALALVPQAFRTAIFPVMSRLYATASPTLNTVYEKSFKYLLVAALPISAALTLAADALVPLLFRSGFDESILVLRVVIWTLVLLMINVPSARMMIVANAQRQLALFQGLSMTLNLGLNLMLIPAMGAMGAACARLSSTGLFVVLGAVYTYQKLNRWNPTQVFVRPMIALFVMLGVGWFLHGINTWLSVLGGLVSYVVMIWWLGVIAEDEQTILVRILHQRAT